jgi:tRNA-uridine 2-sulfurtransferase
MKKRIVLAMSGGVDSSVAAHLLKEQGHEVVGVFMRTGAVHKDDSCSIESPKPKRTRGCCSAIDAADAQRVADRLDIPFYALDFSEDFGRIQDYFVDEYLKARTPNPCVVCNTWLKFGKLWDYAKAVGADAIATGHYARTEMVDGGTHLLRSLDHAKDQSYFLFGLEYEILRHVLFPIGDMPKPRVRAIAEEHGLGVAKKPDSQEICFVPDGDHHGFIQRRRPGSEPVGVIQTVEGQVLGTHTGVSKFTIGQRKGLGVAVGKRAYVVELDADAGRVVIGPEELLRRRTLEAERVNWLVPTEVGKSTAAQVKIRYQHDPTPAVITPMENGAVHIEFAEWQTAITPGQATVFYDAERVLGGGWIA